MVDKNSLASDTNEASQIPGLEGREIVDLSCGDYHGAAIDSDGNLFTWGGGKTA